MNCGSSGAKSSQIPSSQRSESGANNLDRGFQKEEDTGMKGGTLLVLLHLD